MGRRNFLFLVISVVVTGAGSQTAAADGPPPFVVVVNAKNPSFVVDRDFVADAFLKKTTRWPNGDVIKPVDQTSSSPTRARFSEAILKRSVSAVKSYWQQIIFSGRDVPPTEVASDEDVIKFVAAHPGAIGYVSGSTPLGETRAATVRQ